MTLVEVVLVCVFINVMCWIGGLAVVSSIIRAEARMDAMREEFLDQFESRVRRVSTPAPCMKGESDESR